MLFYILLSLALGLQSNILTIEWRPTICFNYPCTKSYLKNSFNIKDFKAISETGEANTNCSEDQFQISLQVMMMLVEFWDYYEDSRHEIWENVWREHGTCILPKVSSEEYFQVAIALFLNSEIQERLKAAEILDSNGKQWGYEDISNALYYKVQIDCFKSEDEEFMLETINLCFNQGFQWENCTSDFGKCESSFILPWI
ncbi:hypothetical protein SteCoe_24754 [Stentor coeruleus]|uniref:Uncharacterized protein n=1 Tax=Stentor coeruleus TaxID=5963 RepID=A0A1R2BGU9_9CILI|nr:hypothetical protein SteCoe_24754 [Stentor coeruleus]